MMPDKRGIVSLVYKSKDTDMPSISLELQRIGSSFKWGANRYCYNLTVIRKNGQRDFSFFDSEDHFDKDLWPEITDAFEAVLSDAIAYVDNKNIDDFSLEFGYDKPSELIKAHEGCKYAYESLTENLGLTEDQLFTLVNELQEAENQ